MSPSVDDIAATGTPPPLPDAQRSAGQRAKGLSGAIADLVRSRPDEWTQGQFELSHASGIRVWTANGCSGLSVRLPGWPAVWGVTSWCLVGGSPEQRRVWNAIRDWRLAQVHALIAKAKA